MRPCFQRGHFLLPNDQIDLHTWSVIACDQYTSQPEYWEKVTSIVQGRPSTLHLIYPEAFLSQGETRIKMIQHTMDQYLKEGVLSKEVQDGFILIERETFAGNRWGLLGLIDLEAYDYDPETDKPIRATEGTIQSRIPPRVKIRKDALLELGHVLILIDDSKKQLIEPLSESVEDKDLLYDFDLMMNGGHVKGYGITGDKAKHLEDKIGKLQQETDGLFLAVGDGNHSLASAKACWEMLKKDLPLEKQASHPARYAMVELVNLHSPALVFEPIHRILFHANMADLLLEFEEHCKEENIEWMDGQEIIFHQDGYTRSIALQKEDDRLPLDVLQGFLDFYLTEHPEVSLDYIHGQEAMEELLKNKENCGIFLDRIDKSSLFSAIEAGGVLPRKTFSMGEADEKRFYLECRIVR